MSPLFFQTICRILGKEISKFEKITSLYSTKITRFSSLLNYETSRIYFVASRAPLNFNIGFFSKIDFTT